MPETVAQASAARRPDEAPAVVILDIFPGNIMRNVNQYRALIGFTPGPLGLEDRCNSAATTAATTVLSWVPKCHNLLSQHSAE